MYIFNHTMLREVYCSVVIACGYSIAIQDNDRGVIVSFEAKESTADKLS